MCQCLASTAHLVPEPEPEFGLLQLWLPGHMQEGNGITPYSQPLRTEPTGALVSHCMGDTGLRGLP